MAQTALSAVLLVGAGLFLRSLHRVTTMDFGVDTENVLVVSINFAGSGRPGRDVVAFYERALERVSAVPGVARASLAIDAPYRGFRGAGIKLPGATDWFNRGDRSQYINFVTPGYFSTTGLRVLAGRDFTAAERAGSGAVIVTEALARAAWPGRSPVGECIGVSSKETGCLPVVGVVATTRDPRGRDADRLVFYQPLDPTDVDSRVLLVRLAPGTRGARVSAGTLRRALHGLDAALPYVDVSTVGSALDYQIRPWRLGAALFTTFGALAALLAALGLYTAVAYAVAQRRRELGVRAALGATAPAIVRFVVADGLRVAVAGVAAGVTLALWGGRWVADLLFDTSPRDATVLGAVTAGLLAVAALASAIPARRAARVSPTEALRAE